MQKNRLYLRSRHMTVVKGTLETTISLSKSTCYFLRTGKCSLSVVSDYFIASSVKTSPNDLLYCPRLYRAMRRREKMKPITVIPCECGHAEVVAGHQRACIASQKNLELPMRAAGGDQLESKAACLVCGGQMTFEKNTGGNRIVTVRAVVMKDEP